MALWWLELLCGSHGDHPSLCRGMVRDGHPWLVPRDFTPCCSASEWAVLGGGPCPQTFPVPKCLPSQNVPSVVTCWFPAASSPWGLGWHLLPPPAQQLLGWVPPGQGEVASIGTHRMLLTLPASLALGLALWAGGTHRGHWVLEAAGLSPQPPVCPRSLARWCQENGLRAEAAAGVRRQMVPACWGARVPRRQVAGVRGCRRARVPGWRWDGKCCKLCAQQCHGPGQRFRGRWGAGVGHECDPSTPPNAHPCREQPVLLFFRRNPSQRKQLCFLPPAAQQHAPEPAPRPGFLQVLCQGNQHCAPQPGWPGFILCAQEHRMGPGGGCTGGRWHSTGQ